MLEQTLEREVFTRHAGKGIWCTGSSLSQGHRDRKKQGGIWTMAGSPAESHHWKRQTEIEKKEPGHALKPCLGIWPFSYKQEGTMVLSRSLSRTIINWADHQSSSVERHSAKCWVPKKVSWQKLWFGTIALVSINTTIHKHDCKSWNPFVIGTVQNPIYIL